MQTFRKKKLGTYQSGEFQSEFDRYINILTNYREGEYNALITPDFKLSKVCYFILFINTLNFI
jgi:hypothetical protein